MLNLVNKKLLLAFLITALSYLSLAPLAFAQIVNFCPGAPFKALCLTADSLSGIIGAIISFIFIIGVFLALLFLLYGALRWIYSGGDKASIEAARSNIIAAIIGLVILFLTFLGLNILLGFFNVNITNINLPVLPTP